MQPPVRHSPKLAAVYGAPIGLLGGLIGLGGAEFRLPVLAGVFGYRARRAVALNLAISLITVVSALLIRAGTLSVAPVVALLPVVIAMIAGRSLQPTWARRSCTESLSSYWSGLFSCC
jgi:uncharacterized protein